MANSANWRSPDGERNAIAVQTLLATGFEAISEIDRIGHLILFRAGKKSSPASLEEIVGVALLRRAVTVFASLRQLLEQSLADPARALARAQFEIWLNYRALAYGSLRTISLDTPTVPAERSTRAEYFFLSSERRGLLSRALLLHPASPYRPSDQVGRDALARELAEEVVRLRSTFPDSWTWFGDTPSDSIAVKAAVLADREWFAHMWPDRSVQSIRALAHAFGYEWEYDFTYDAFSALVHARGVRYDVEFDGAYCNIRHPHDDSWLRTVAHKATFWQLLILMTAAKWQVPEMVPQLQSLHLRFRDALKSLEPDEFPLGLG